MPARRSAFQGQGPHSGRLVGVAGLEPTSMDYRSTALTFVLLAVYAGLKPFSCLNSPYGQSYSLPSDRSRRLRETATISSKVGKLIKEIAPSNCVGLGFGGVPSLTHGRAIHAYRTVSGA